MPVTPRLRKPLWVVKLQEQDSDEGRAVERHLTLFDLVCVGVGGTVGSGIFVLAGYVAHDYSGPATAVSFAISGLAACCSGICYAELAGRLPTTGSTYTYAYVAIGELTAVITAACLSLEYVVSGGAVARSWGSKVIIWLTDQFGVADASQYLVPGFGVNLGGLLISALSTAILAKGITESKFTTNFFTTLKVLLILFMTIGAFCFFNPVNLTPFAPKGITGVMHGATSSFFAYLGFDEVCVISGEALNPKRDMPRSVLYTLLIVTSVYIVSVFALTGMQPYNDINTTSGFSVAFQANGAGWMAQITAAGEILTLPVVVLVCLLAQPRMLQALAMDGILPSFFSEVDSGGNLRKGAIVSGVVMTLLAAFVPFHYLNDLISAGILVAYCITNCCLVLLRCEPPTNQPRLAGSSLVVFNTLCFITGLSLSRTSSIALQLSLALLTTLTFLYMWWKCPRTEWFGASILQTEDSDSSSYFETPFVPLIPCIGMFVNWFLIAQLSNSGLVMLVGYVLAVAGVYGGFCGKFSTAEVGGWRRDFYEPIGDVSDEIIS